MTIKNHPDHLLTPEEVVLWVPGKITVDSTDTDWENIAIRGYIYNDLNVLIPAMRDYMIVNYREKSTTMRRKTFKGWESQVVQSGVVSLLTCGEQSRWAWNDDIEVCHVYVSHSAITQIANQVFDYDIENIRIRDRVGVRDPVLSNLTTLLEMELHSGGVGGNLYIEGIKNQIGLHLLRQYAELEFREGRSHQGFNPLERRMLREYIHANLGQKITLEDMATLVRMSVANLMRKFKVDFGQSPAAFVMRLRIDYAKMLILSGKEIPLKAVALEAGFCDQSHLTRVFKKFLNTTPVEFKLKNQGRKGHGQLLVPTTDLDE